MSDPVRAKNFYRNVFGFVEGPAPLVIENEHQAMLGIDGDVGLHATFLRCDGLVIELLHFTAPQPIGPPQARPMYQFGLTHLSFNVDSIEETLEAVVRCGGRILTDTRSTFHLPHMTGELIFVTDPDGTRMELMEFPDDVRMA